MQDHSTFLRKKENKTQQQKARTITKKEQHYSINCFVIEDVTWEIPQHLPIRGTAKSSITIFSISKCPSYTLIMYPFLVEKVLSHRASGLQRLCVCVEGRSGRTIDPLMCSDTFFGSSPTIQPKASQIEDLHGGPSLQAASSNTMFQMWPVGKYGKMSQHSSGVLALAELQKWGKEALIFTVPAQTWGPSLPTHGAGAQTGFG